MMRQLVWNNLHIVLKETTTFIKVYFVIKSLQIKYVTLKKSSFSLITIMHLSPNIAPVVPWWKCIIKNFAAMYRYIILHRTRFGARSKFSLNSVCRILSNVHIVSGYQVNIWIIFLHFYCCWRKWKYNFQSRIHLFCFCTLFICHSSTTLNNKAGTAVSALSLSLSV